MNTQFRSTKNYPRRKRTQTIVLIENYSCNTNQRSKVKPLTHIEVRNLFDDPVSNMTAATSGLNFSSKDDNKKRKVIQKANQNIQQQLKIIIKLKNVKTMIKKLKSTTKSTTIMEDDIVNCNKDNVYSYKNCNFKTLKLEICS